MRRAGLLCLCLLFAAPLAACGDGGGGEREAGLLTVSEITLEPGEIYELRECAADGVAINRLTFSAENAAVAQVTDKGTLTAAAEGETLLTVRDGSGGAHRIAVKVMPGGYFGGDFPIERARFKGRQVAVYGDSITQRVGLSGGEPDYLELVQRRLGFRFRNFAVGGTCIAYPNENSLTVGLKPDTNGAYYVQANAAYNREAAYATVFYGTNDFNMAIPMGEDSDDPATYEQATTFKGAINFVVKTLRAHNPDVRIVFMTPLYRALKPYFGGDTVNELGLTLTDYCDAVRSLGAKHKVKVVELYDLITADTVNEYTVDLLHPNAAGHALIAERFLGEI